MSSKSYDRFHFLFGVNMLWRIMTIGRYIIFFLISLSASPLHGQTPVPQEYIGHWRGVSGSAELKQSAKIGAAFASKDIGHTVESFEFDIREDGSITGHGVALYWFNVSAVANLMVTTVAPQAYLEGKVKRIEFTIEGKANPDGVVMHSKVEGRLALISAGKKTSIEAWNLFGASPALLRSDGGEQVIGWSGTVGDQGMRLEWHAVKGWALEIYEISTPGPDYSFISTDQLLFRARVNGSPQMTAKIGWRSEDGKVDKIDSGSLQPSELKESPDYPATPPLKPAPPPAPNGRQGRLSYKISASAEGGGDISKAAATIQQDELDQLRQEYVDMRKSHVPQRNEFTRDGRQFNTGDYRWAMVKQVASDGYATIVQAFAPNVTNLNSA